MAASLSGREKFGAGLGCVLLLAILLLALSGTFRRMSLGDNPPTEFQSEPANYTYVPCPSVKFGTFKHGVEQFARQKKLDYRGQAHDDGGSVFVITLEDERHRIWISGRGSTALVSQYLPTGATPAPSDKQLFDDLVQVLSRCGNQPPASGQ
ncbi:MAG TPA: hypothetical protein VGR19_05905 [Allosphingosinicella sp.]|nr:hypothetical protein [Allosphingosinicella sp.]